MADATQADMAGFSRNPADLPPGESATQGSPVMAAAPINDSTVTPDQIDKWLLQKASTMYITSTDYMTANITKTWERNLAHFRNEHAPGTRYRKADWHRSRTFRPKTRANVKAQEASLAAAAFSTADLVDIQPMNPSNENAAIGSKLLKGTLEHRLKTKMPWFLTTQGAFQDTKNYGICISYQHWRYRAETNLEVKKDADGEPVLSADDDQMPQGVEKVSVKQDELVCDLFAPENFRFDPMCDWRSPAKTSPYIIALFPMHVVDVQEMMEADDSKTGQQTWRKYGPGAILATKREHDNRTRQAREGYNRIDPLQTQEGNEFTIVWAHMNICRIEGEDIMWWTLGTDLVLTDPEPLTDAYPWLAPGERPFVVGYSSVEAHRNFPAGDVEQAAPVQAEINDIANQRMDNVKLVLNKRYFTRRGSQIDLEALMRNVPGGGVMTNDPEKDVKIVSTPDVTSSSYQEQDRLSTEFDELVGGFGPGSMASNKGLPDSKGGMEQAAGSAGAVQDYGINIFFETWYQPVLRQLVRLEQTYETDEEILAIGAQQAQLFEKLGTNNVTDELIQQDLLVQVNVGMGNTDPMKRVQKLVFGTSQVMGLPGMSARAKVIPLANEIFGTLGYKDASRFFMNDAEFAAMMKKAGPQPPSKQMLDAQELQIRAQDNQMRDTRERSKLAIEREIAYADLALKYHLTMEQIYTQLGVEQQRQKTERDTTALTEANRLSELNMNRITSAGVDGGK